MFQIGNIDPSNIQTSTRGHHIRMRINITRKRFSEKTIVAFTNSTVFILDFYIQMTKPVWSHVLASSALPNHT